MSHSFLICFSWIREYTGSLSDFDLFIWTLVFFFVAWIAGYILPLLSLLFTKCLILPCLENSTFFFLFAKSTPFVYFRFFNMVILSSVGLKFSIFSFFWLVFLKALFFTQWRDVIWEKGLFPVVVVRLHKWIETQLIRIWSLIILSSNLLYL